MVRPIATWLLAPLLAVALLAGCGSSSSSSSSSTSTSAATTGSTASTAAKLPQVASAVASCKQGVQRLPQLRASTRERLEQICEKAGSGDKQAVQKAAEEGCREIVNASPLPAGSAKDRALAACKHAGGSK